jgi:hypothetical protein
VNYSSLYGKEITTLRKHTNLGYGEIAAKTEAKKKYTVQYVSKRLAQRCHVNDASWPGRPSKVAKSLQKRIEATVYEHPRAPLCDIAEISQTGLSNVTVDKVIKDLGFVLRIPPTSIRVNRRKGISLPCADVAGLFLNDVARFSWTNALLCIKLIVLDGRSA